MRYVVIFLIFVGFLASCGGGSPQVTLQPTTSTDGEQTDEDMDKDPTEPESDGENPDEGLGGKKPPPVPPPPPPTVSELTKSTSLISLSAEEKRK